jgi:hypothetical protein
MSSSPQVGVSLVEAIQNNHIPLQDAAQDVLDRVLLSNANNAATRQSQRDLLQSMVESIDSVVRQIDVWIPFCDDVTDNQTESHTIVADTFGSDFDSIIDVVKNLAAELENVATIHSQVEQDNTFAFVHTLLNPLSNPTCRMVCMISLKSTTSMSLPQSDIENLMPQLRY